MIDPTLVYARTAFAHGYARAGDDAFPVHPRARVALEAATHAARARADAGDDPRAIIEGTVHLGNATGLWALVLRRRDAAERAHGAAVRQAFAAARSRADIDGLVADLLAYRVEALSPLRAHAAARALVHLEQLPATDLRTALRDASLAGAALGTAAAAAFVDAAMPAESSLTTTFHDRYDAAIDKLRALDSFWADADRRLAELFGASAREIGSIIADGIDAGLTKEELIARVREFFTSNRYAELVTGDAIAASMTSATVDYYRGADVEQVDFITTGDDLVDEECADAEDNNPYPLAAAPQPPLHPNCRCVLAVAVT